MSYVQETLVIYLSILLLAAIGFFKSAKGTLKKFFEVTPSLKNRRTWILPIVLLILNKTIFVILPGLNSTHDSQLGTELQDLMKINFFWTIAIVLVGGIIFPIVEETLFRGFIINSFLGRRREIIFLGIILANVLFTFSHTNSNFDKFVSGVLYTYLRFETGSLVMPIILHIGLNCVALGTMGVLIKFEQFLV